MKRIAIYYFEEQSGVVDDYVYYYLQNLKLVAHKILVVVNGSIEDQYLSKLKALEIDTIYTENFTDKFNFYKFGISNCQDLSSYDELILSDNSSFGPFFPLDKIFNDMENRNSREDSDVSRFDFWGIIRCKQGIKRRKNLLTRIFKKPQEQLLQPFFVVLKQNVFCSSAFTDFFNNNEKSGNDWQNFDKFEILFEKMLIKSGFKCGAYISDDCFTLADFTVYSSNFVKDYHVPFIKTASFAGDYSEFVGLSRGNQSRRLLEYLGKERLYEPDLIWQYLLRTQTLSSLVQNLQYHFVLSSKYVHNPHIVDDLKLHHKKCALIVYIYYVESLSTCFDYIASLNNLADIYIVSSREETLAECKHQSELANITVKNFILKQNKGRDVASYLIECRDVFFEYDYVCYFHDKRSPHLSNKFFSSDFFEHCMESILPSREYALNVLNLLESEPKLGLLVPPPLNWGQFYYTEHALDENNEIFMKEILKKLHIDLPFDRTPLAPYGDYFWCRTAALRKLFDLNWSYADLPDEPIPAEGTILHAIERIHPTIAQASGYFTSRVNSDMSEEVFGSNNYFYQKNFAESMYQISIMQNVPTVSFNGQLQNMKAMYLFSRYARKVHLRFKLIKYFSMNLLTLFLFSKFRHRLFEITKELQSMSKSVFESSKRQ